jgi:hypothetical protein
METEKDLEVIIIKGNYDYVAHFDASNYPKDGSTFELTVVTPDGAFLLPLAYWDKTLECFTAKIPEGWHYPFTLTLRPTPDAPR